MILNMWNIYTKYLDQANKANKKYDKIYICRSRSFILVIKKEYTVFHLQQQIVKVKHYIKMIDILQSLVSAKLD